MPLVSVLMPSYNHGRFISETIESVLNQTFADFELIIIDDASKDNSKEIIKDYKEKDSRIRALFHDENKGIARTMNEGIKEAKGKYISFFSSDDLWVSNKLEKQVEMLEKNEDLVVWSEGLVIDAQGNFTGETFTQKHGALKRKKSGDIFEELLKGNYICGQSVILKRENLEGIRYDEQLKYLNDYRFMVDLAKKYKFYFIPEPLAMYRMHGKNSILSDGAGWRKDTIIIYEYFLQKYGNEISNNTKCKLLFKIGVGYLGIGEKEKAIRCIYSAIKINPFYWENIYFLGTILTGNEENVQNILKWIYKRYKVWIQKSQS